jgi:hypothetical protein
MRKKGGKHPDATAFSSVGEVKDVSTRGPERMCECVFTAKAWHAPELLCWLGNPMLPRVVLDRVKPLEFQAFFVFDGVFGRRVRVASERGESSESTCTQHDAYPSVTRIVDEK